MNLKDLMKVAAVGVLVYAAYKLGQKRGDIKSYDGSNSSLDYLGEIIDENVRKTEEEIDFIKETLNSLSKKTNKTKKDIDTIQLLKIKLNQLI